MGMYGISKGDEAVTLWICIECPARGYLVKMVMEMLEMAKF